MMIRRVDFECLNGDRGTLEISADAKIRIERNVISPFKVFKAHFLGANDDHGRDDFIFIEIYPAEKICE